MRESADKLAKYLPWVIWVVSSLAYLAALLNRTSFAKLGVTAQEHFGIEATALSLLLVMQVLVYAGMQIPVGIMLDRFGASIVITAGLLLMACGQALMAFAPNVLLAIFARVLVGIGDAGLFISALRLVADWFPVKLVPMVSQFTGMLGSAGQIAAVLPFAWVVNNLGWAFGFTLLAALTFVMFAATLFVLSDFAGGQTVFLRLWRRGSKKTLAAAAAVADPEMWDSPIGHISPPTAAIPVVGPAGSGIFAGIKSLLGRPGLRLAYWIHFGTAGSVHCFVLLWGSAFLTGGLGLSPQAAAFLLSLVIVATITVGLVLGPLQSRFKRLRLHYVVGYIAVLALCWALVLYIDFGEYQMAMLCVFAVVLGAGGPSCMIAFDVVRTHVHRNQIGLATGIINTGSFTAALSLIFVIGLVLDLQHAGTPETYTAEAFRVAMSFQFVFLLIALAAIAFEFPKARNALRRRQDRLQAGELTGGFGP